MMAGARWEHHFIVQNLNLGISNQLRAQGSNCRVFTETFRLQDDRLKSSILPDVLVRCGPLPPGASSLKDPAVLVEVMSDGSAGPDRVETWRVDQKLASLKHYVLVERDQALLDVFDRQGEVSFRQRILEGMDAILDLPAIGVSISLAEIYRDVLTA